MIDRERLPVFLPAAFAYQKSPTGAFLRDAGTESLACSFFSLEKERTKEIRFCQGEFRPLRWATWGSAPRPRNLLKKVDQNFIELFPCSLLSPVVTPPCIQSFPGRWWRRRWLPPCRRGYPGSGKRRPRPGRPPPWGSPSSWPRPRLPGQ